MSEKIDLAIEKFSNAQKRLEEVTKLQKNELYLEGILKRFEFTFELMWKALKMILDEEGIVTNSPKSCLKEAFKLGFISDDLVFWQMLNDRNQSTHACDEKEVRKVSESIVNRYIPAIKDTLSKIKKKYPSSK